MARLSNTKRSSPTIRDNIQFRRSSKESSDSGDDKEKQSVPDDSLVSDSSSDLSDDDIKQPIGSSKRKILKHRRSRKILQDSSIEEEN